MRRRPEAKGTCTFHHFMQGMGRDFPLSAGHSGPSFPDRKVPVNQMLMLIH